MPVPMNAGGGTARQEHAGTTRVAWAQQRRRLAPPEVRIPQRTPRGLALEDGHSGREPRLRTEGDVNLAPPLAAGVGRCCPRKLQRRTAALLLDHFDLPQRQTARPARAKGLEEGLLRRESGGQRLRAVGSLP